MAAASTVSALSNSIKIHYSNEFMENHQNTNSKLRTKLQTVKNVKQNGKTFDWEFYLQSPQVVGTPNDGAAVPTPSARVSVAGSVTVAQFVGGFSITPLAEALATQSGSWNGGEVKRSIKEAVTDVTKHMNRLYSGTHGTGRLAQVNAATSASASFVAKLPIGSLLLRPNMIVGAYIDDTGTGAVRDSLTAIKISKVVPSTRTVTLASGTYTLVANDHIYIHGSYGGTRVPNGLAGIVDDGTNLTSIHGQSRSTYDELKSVVLSAGGNLRDLTEDHLITLCHLINQKSGMYPDLIVWNSGQLAKYFKNIRADRRLNVTGGDVPGYNSGYKKDPTLFVGGQAVQSLCSEDVSPRTVYALNTSQLRIIQSIPLEWMDWGGTIFQQTVESGGGYSLGKQATLLGAENLATYLPAAHGRIDDLSDPELCGSFVGDTDL